MIRNLLKRLALRLGCEGGGGGWEDEGRELVGGDVLENEEVVGDTGLAPEAGGIDVGGAVCVLLSAGAGGTRGTFSGGIVESEMVFVDDEGLAGVADCGGSGGAGWGLDAVLLEVPGRTIASESCMLGFVFESGILELASDLFWSPSAASLGYGGVFLLPTCEGQRV